MFNFASFEVISHLLDSWSPKYVLINASKPTAMLDYLGKPSDVQKYLVSLGLKTERHKTRSQGKVEEESKKEEYYESDYGHEGSEVVGGDKLDPMINHYQIDTVGSFYLITTIDFRSEYELCT